MDVRRSATPRHQLGMTLIEMVIVVGIMVAVLGLGTMWLRAQGESARRDDFIAAEARDLSQIAEAMKKYAAANATAWAGDTLQQVTIAQLVTAGHLPADFANRTGAAAGTTPFGQAYYIGAIKDGTTPSIVRTVITENGAIMLSRLERAGIKNTAEAIRGLKEAIAQKVATDYRYAAAVAPANSRTVRGAMGSFTKDLTAWIATTPANAIAALLLGFPDLGCSGPDCGDGGGTPTPPAGGQYSFCQVVPAFDSLFDCPVSQTATGGVERLPCRQQGAHACPAGMTQVASWSRCDATYPIVGTEVGALSVGFSESDNLLPCGCSDSDGTRHVDTCGSRTRYLLTSVNAVNIRSDVCEHQEKNYRMVGGYCQMHVPTDYSALPTAQNLLCCQPR